ncbi:hypothetical protein [Anaeromyxobacter sp. SG66]|uniref:hypothetical protein n=1 Tax=Anaeromyxobacter sp. SG66 TaxID=2925410 RepID=UPI001F58769B|nr:hypothetical protein [Anaeromyxobacter sp. SG66]
MLDTPSLLLLSIALYVTVAGAAAVYVHRVRRAGVFEPISVFLLFFSVFVLPLPIRAYVTSAIEGNISEHLPSLVPFLPPAVVLATAGLVLFVAGYYSPAARRVATLIPHPDPRPDDQPVLAFLLLFAFSSLLIQALVSQLGGIIPFLLLGYGSSAETFGRGYLAVGFPWMFVASLFLLYKYSLARELRYLLVFSAVAVVNAGMMLLTGNRSLILYMTIAVLAMVDHSIRPLRLRVLIPLGAVAFLLLNAVGYFRGSDYESVSDYVAKASEFASGLRDPGEKKDTFFYTLTTGEFVVPFETLPQMIRSVGSDLRPWYGASYLRTPLYYIPSALYPERPLPLTNWYMNQFYGGGYGLNEGRAFFFMSEGYLNFGIIGALAIALAWGIGFGALWHYGKNSGNNPGSAMLYALTVAFMFRAIAGDFSSILVGLPVQNLSASVLGLVVATRARGWKWVTA